MPPVTPVPNTADPFAAIRDGTSAHRRQHGCRAYPFSDGSVLGVIAAAAGARRVLELGTALGYTALWFAHGAGDARVDTIEHDPEHVRIARANIAEAGFAARVAVHEGDFEAVMAGLAPGYDVAFFDGFVPSLAHLAMLRGLLRVGGVLVSSNLDAGRGDAYRAAVADGTQWLTSYALEDGRTAISIKR